MPDFNPGTSRWWPRYWLGKHFFDNAFCGNHAVDRVVQHDPSCYAAYNPIVEPFVDYGPQWFCNLRDICAVGDGTTDFVTVENMHGSTDLAENGLTRLKRMTVEGVVVWVQDYLADEVVYVLTRGQDGYLYTVSWHPGNTYTVNRLDAATGDVTLRIPYPAGTLPDTPYALAVDADGGIYSMDANPERGCRFLPPYATGETFTQALDDTGHPAGWPAISGDITRLAFDVSGNLVVTTWADTGGGSPERTYRIPAANAWDALGTMGRLVVPSNADRVVWPGKFSDDWEIDAAGMGVVKVVTSLQDNSIWRPGLLHFGLLESEAESSFGYIRPYRYLSGGVTFPAQMWDLNTYVQHTFSLYHLMNVAILSGDLIALALHAQVGAGIGLFNRADVVVIYEREHYDQVMLWQ